MSAIIKKEFQGYFTSGIGHVVLTVFFFFSSYFWYICLYNRVSSITYAFQNILTVFIFLIPIMTMRLFSEEKKQRTDQALLTAPVSITQIVMGKFLGSALLFSLCMSIFLVFGIVNSFFAVPDWPVLLCTFLGVYMWGIAFISIGIFISSLTESQVISAVGGFAAGLILLMIDNVKSMTNNEVITYLVSSVSFYGHFNKFALGILNLQDIVFFLSVPVLFLFFTVKVIEKRRWS